MTMEKEEEGEVEEPVVDKGRRARKSWLDAPLGFLAFMLLGNAVLKFVFALLPFTDISAGKLADAVLGLGVRAAISFLLLWGFTRLRTWKSRKTPETRQ
ncbi:hypothetical protein AB0I51_47785 [Streptomyces sp. NPDC050549]|uniref:hypothetical protein n=1 Tax=Streptomyces sp. NPDC050549 TaxID=3155406 RepID=UPI0034446C37